MLFYRGRCGCGCGLLEQVCLIYFTQLVHIAFGRELLIMCLALTRSRLSLSVPRFDLFDLLLRGKDSTWSVAVDSVDSLLRADQLHGSAEVLVLVWRQGRGRKH